MRLPKLSRRQKMVRNLLFILLALFLISWENQFPSLTKGGLLRRAERMYLIETPSEVLYEEWDLDGGFIAAQSGDQLLLLNCDRTLVGLRLGSTGLYDEPILVKRDYERGGRGEWEYDYPGFTAVGLLEEAASAEVELYIAGGLNTRWVIPGEKVGEHCFKFRYERRYEENDTSLEAQQERTMLQGMYSSLGRTVTARFYDEEGVLVAEVREDRYF